MPPAANVEGASCSIGVASLLTCSGPISDPDPQQKFAPRVQQQRASDSACCYGSPVAIWDEGVDERDRPHTPYLSSLCAMCIARTQRDRRVFRSKRRQGSASRGRRERGQDSGWHTTMPPWRIGTRVVPWYAARGHTTVHSCLGCTGLWKLVESSGGETWPDSPEVPDKPDTLWLLPAPRVKAGPTRFWPGG